MVVGFQENDLDKLDSVIKSDTHKDISLEMQTENNLREENIELQRYVSEIGRASCRERVSAEV